MRQSLCEEMLLELTRRKSALIPFPFENKNESNFDNGRNIRARRGRREFDIDENFRVANSMARVSAQLTRAFAWFGLSARVNGVIA